MLSARAAELAARAGELAARAGALERALAESEAARAALETALAAEQARRAERELAWFDYTRSVAALGLDARELGIGFESEHQPAEPAPASPPIADPNGLGGPSEPDEPAEPAQPSAEELAWQRGAELGRKLAALLAVHGAHGLDLLEAGRLHVPAQVEPEAGQESGAPELGQRWLGPVVFRLLDGRGRLAGSLAAERLHLELSRAARSVTLVLESGHELCGGERRALEPGGRRIVLGAADPAVWLAELPELFPPEAHELPLDDGLWDVARVEREIAVLLERACPAGAGTRYRLHRVGGVVGDALVDVALVVRTSNGEPERWLFADRLEIELASGVVALVLEGGAAVRGAERAPFLDGRLKLVLPDADPAEWRAAGLPGLALGDREAPLPLGG